ncbi:hypothetical protein [Rubripirellula obstinata]|nr:hypothetical protein [Rubripirellula obstinata]
MIDDQLRAEVLLHASGSCQICEATINRDQIKLIVCAKKNQLSSKPLEASDLWAICQSCQSRRVIANREDSVAMD